MSRNHFDREIEAIRNKLLKLTSIVEKSLNDSVKAVETQDVELANKIREADCEIDDLEVELEEDCLKLLALYQPVASDLRYLIATLKINNDVERIGDLAGNIASRARALTKFADVKCPYDLGKLTFLVQKMFKDAMISLVEQSVEKARKVLEDCLLYTSPSPRDATLSRMPSSA